MKPLYVIEWLDAWHSGASYYSSHEDNTTLTCTDVGFLMEENDEGVVLATSFTEDSNQYRHVSFFPWEMIISMEVLI